MTTSGASPSSGQPAGGLDAYLGAARVVGISPASVLVALDEEAVSPGTLVHAVPALTFPYKPALGDSLLVIGDARSFYVIGVLSGRGQVSLSNARGVSLRAEGGSLRMVGDRGVRVSGSRLLIEAERWKQVAVTAVSTFGERVSRARSVAKVEAGELDESSQGRFVLQARRVVVKALKNARIKSTAVRVG